MPQSAARTMHFIKIKLANFLLASRNIAHSKTNEKSAYAGNKVTIKNESFRTKNRVTFQTEATKDVYTEKYIEQRI